MAKLFIFTACVIGYVGALIPVQRQNIHQQRDTSSPFDHSNVKSLASLGDSFAAGIGAGTRLTGWGDWYCSRYDTSYPSLINTDPSLGDPKGRTFQYFACSGAITTDVTNSQIPSLKSGIQMATLSIGGNDAKLANILAACIYNWNKDPKLDCDKTLDDSQAIIDDPKFASNFDDLINKLKPHMADANSKIFWTGYSHFWDDSTNECDKVTWMFKYNLGNRQYLTQARRTKMNSLVDSVNQKIQDAVQRAGSQAVYVPWGANVDYIQGHYCEPGVDESNAVDREQTAFYEWGSTLDDQEYATEKNELRRRQTPGSSPGSAPGVLQAGQNLNDTWEGFIASAVLEGIASGASPADYGLSDDDVVHAQSGLLLPDKYGRVFHPQQHTHLMMAENILRTLDDIAAKAQGQKAATTTLVGCPAPTGPASHGGEHNMCYSDLGDSNAVTFNVKDGTAAINTYCSKHKGDKVPPPSNGIYDTVPNGGDKSTSIALRAMLDTEAPCQNFKDAGKWNVYDCQSNLLRLMNDCDKGTQDKKKGGERTADCISYSIEATKNAAPASPPPPAYAKGTCSLHLNQTRSGGDQNDAFSSGDAAPDYTVSIDIFDDKKVNIGHHDSAAAGAGNSLGVDSKLSEVLVITPEARDDYVQFSLGSQSWKSSDDKSCSEGGWDPKESDDATRQMDCSFSC